MPHPPILARAAAIVAPAAIASALLLASPAPLARLAGGLIALAGGVALGWRLARGSAAPHRLATRAENTAGTPLPAVVDPAPSELRRAIESRRREGGERRRAELVGQYLRDLRDTCGADEAVFWRLDPRSRALVPFAESGVAGASNTSRDTLLPLVRWAADERIVHFDGSEDVPRFVVGPIADERRVHGALSLRATAGLAWPRERFKQWMPRFTAHLALLADLLETREDVERQNLRMQALMRAAQHFQSNRSSESLGRAICDTALEVSSATRAALVRWHPGTGTGVVQSVSDGHPVEACGEIDGDSQVAAMCRDGLPQVWEDARMIARHTRIFGGWEAQRPIGSLAIVPLKSDSGTIGAIVVEGDDPGDVLIAEARNVRLLGVLAAAALESLWEIEEVSRRARTDQLTGLANRREFEEQLGRVLAQADRFGGSVSLVVSDIDFFKRVNDTHGHEAGDAVLRHVARLFDDGKREVDVSARYGGEEIAVLLPQTSADGAVEFAERLRRAIEARPLMVGGRQIQVTASFGVSTYPDISRSQDALFPSADRALYKAKADGRNCVRRAEPTRDRERT